MGSIAPINIPGIESIHWYSIDSFIDHAPETFHRRTRSNDENVMTTAFYAFRERLDINLRSPELVRFVYVGYKTNLHVNIPNALFLSDQRFSRTLCSINVLCISRFVLLMKPIKLLPQKLITK